ncbi:nuclear protein [Vararia minispora EC-137]|uniref:Nuclear protein n=1 Tax=Vararia minispora EC-137 TaxID=1314806 RepID=A0ACB8QWJ9_9AGAM|nr:nuclear protein [Vararia minispora EC-137]
MTKPTHERSTSPDADEQQSESRSLLKRLKIGAHADETIVNDPTPCFASDLLHPNTIQRLNASYRDSEPFKYALIEKLFRDDLLEKVKDECLSEIAFTQKETDIYRVHQTGDLASLSYLTPDQVALLPNLLKVRDALYSPKFRQFIRTVTGCGPLSGSKQDMSVNTYKKGCHLLNHDDVIGTRRVSYILYMPLPHFQMWQPSWGGALELYPVVPGPSGVFEPAPVPSKSIPPSWNQFVFFEVQPGRSFHSVEEVVVGEGEDGRQRLSISGWFHAAQLGEEGYELEPVQALQSSREQLASSSTNFSSYPESETPPLPNTPLSPEYTSLLAEFLNPVYLQPRTIKALAQRFVEESSLELHDFLVQPIASKLRTGLRERDERDGLGLVRPQHIPPHSAGDGDGWILKGPPHKWRYATLAEPQVGGPSEAVSERAAQAPDRILRALQDELFGAPAFRAWLADVCQMVPLRHTVEARRFRPGLDYTLATSEEKEARLDVVLGLTPPAGSRSAETADGCEDKNREPSGWESGDWGGWECYMAPHGEEDDPAVYRSGPSKKSNGNGLADGNGDENGNEHVGNSSAEHRKRLSPSAQDVDMDAEVEGEGEEDVDEDGTLLTVQPSFNRLLLVLRDGGLMRFVKYVSAAAEGSRWDVCGEYEVGMVEEDGED